MPGSVKPPAASTASKRIKKEIADLAKENLGDISLSPDEANIFVWKAILPGPAGSPYEGGMFEVDIRIPPDYPFSPPKLLFLTKVYHCNVAHTGAICLDLLKNAWSPALSLYKVILSLSSLLTDPNPADPLVPSIATEYRNNRKKHDATAREWVKQFAQPKVTSKPPPAPAPKVARPRPVRRDTSSTTPASTSATTSAPAPVLGRRNRQHVPIGGGSGGTIDLASDSEHEGDYSGIEILGENPSHGNQTAGPSNGHRGTREPPRKKVRAVAQDDDDVIVVED